MTLKQRSKQLESQDEFTASWHGLDLRAVGRVVPLLGAYIATIVIGLGLLLLGSELSEITVAALIIAMFLVSSFLTWRWMEIQGKQAEDDHVGDNGRIFQIPEE